ncbi:hypothetical protein D3C75_965550 [compost metagenome]
MLLLRGFLIQSGGQLARVLNDRLLASGGAGDRRQVPAGNDTRVIHWRLGRPLEQKDFNADLRCLTGTAHRNPCCPHDNRAASAAAYLSDYNRFIDYGQSVCNFAELLNAGAHRG